jgi:predicted PurR-regulated permease PerM
MQTNKNPIYKTILTLSGLIIIFAGLKVADKIIIPFFLSMFISLISFPLLTFFKSKNINNPASVTLVLITIMTVSLSIAALIGTSLNSFRKSLPDYKEKIYGEIDKVLILAEKYDINISSEILYDYVDPTFIMQSVANTISAFGNVLTNYFLILFIVMFTLLEAAGFSNKLKMAFNNTDQSIATFHRFSENMNKYLTIKTFISMITGLLVYISLSLINLDHAIMWGLIAFFLNYIPNIGSIIASIPAIIIALIQLNFYYALLVALIYLVINVVMGSIIEPRYLGKELGLSTLIIFLSLVFWGWLLGPVGMLLSVPLTMVVKIWLESNDDSKWIAVMLGSGVNK